jgi:hypothetical protein
MNIIEMFSLRKLYNNTTSFVFNLFHNNGLLNLIDLCDKHGLKVVLSSILNNYFNNLYNNKLNNFRMRILDDFNNIESLSTDDFKLKFYNFIKNYNLLYDVIKYNPFLYSLLIPLTSKYYINGFIDDKQLNKLNKLKDNINNKLYVIEDDKNDLYNDMKDNSKNRKILLFIKHLMIEYIISLLDILLDEYKDVFNKDIFNNIEYGNYLITLNEDIKKMNIEIEEIVELYNKEINE